MLTLARIGCPSTRRRVRVTRRGWYDLVDHDFVIVVVVVVVVLTVDGWLLGHVVG